ncbi:hypothetical protein [Candidatus Uabimicrobium amorphum]|uniref:Uncharacterized protein n=1 Tax=Uabimicrobium amorphum TaxID=2596890 RepID=A0A5S9F6X5_UABAM|nr:hypothetical protein [Candidatus Uabimicrobium amorphum]BBM88112.1 hypothetical protein UABAM_06528 [Candidatus Uabimicrobium amorphum]
MTAKKNALMQLQRVLQTNIQQKEFRQLTVRLESKGRVKNVPLFKWMEKKATTHVATWPEWAALIDKQPKKSALKRYEKQQSKPVAITPGVFHMQHKKTLKSLHKDMQTYLQKSIMNSLNKFEQIAAYKEATAKVRKNISIARIEKIPELLPLKDILHPSKYIARDIIEEINERIAQNIKDLQTLPYPYRKDEHLRWNLAMILRVQSLLKTNYIDRLSRIIAAAERNFYHVFCKEIITAEVLPCLVRVISNPNLLAKL